MRYRTLGRTGIQVSPYALGAMMFGAIGAPDQAAYLPAALTRGSPPSPRQQTLCCLNTLSALPHTAAQARPNTQKEKHR